MANRDERRTILIAAGLAGAGALLAVCSGSAKSANGADTDEEVTPVEDLMREHGVVRRVLLVYDEIAHRIEARQPFPPDALSTAAGIIRRFIEDYHEKLEEELVFPRFERAGQLVDLVTVLRRQHDVGRRLTDTILARSPSLVADQGEQGGALLRALRAFAAMYRPHAAREDTVLFPALRPLVGAKAYEALGEVFEEREHALFGPHGFERMVGEVAQIEEVLGIHDLAKLTPA